MNRLRNTIALFAFALLILALPSIVSAQGRNNRNNRNDNYGNGRNNRNLNATIKDLKNRSKSFEKRVDRELDRSRYDETRREDRINDLAGNFRRAADDLDDEYDNRRDYNDSYDEARRVLDLGSQLDRVVSRARLNSNLQNDWNRIRQDLRVLAGAYNYNYDNRRNNDRNDDYRRNRRGDNRRNDNRRGNNDWWRNFPFPN